MRNLTSYRSTRGRILAGACLLVLAGLSQAGAQFLPQPGQSSPAGKGTAFPPPAARAAEFPPPPAQSQSFPAPSPQSQDFVPPPSQGQSFDPPPGAGGPANFSPAQAERAQQVCGGFQVLGQDMEKSLVAVNSAGERKAPREEACPLFKTLSAKEVKAIKFLETNRQLCNIPQSFIKQLQDRHAHIVKIAKAVCAQPPPGATAGPSLSDALGGPIIADDSSAKLGGRTFDTLTGNALQR